MGQVNFKVYLKKRIFQLLYLSLAGQDLEIPISREFQKLKLQRTSTL